MFLAQLAAFLVAHCHAHWAAILATCSPHKFALIYHWAMCHGFRYQP